MTEAKSTRGLHDPMPDAPRTGEDRVEELLSHSIDVPVLASVVERQEAADAADTLERLDDEEAADVLEQMDDRPAAEALAEMETPLAIGVLADLVEEDAPYVGRLLQVMAPDDAARLLRAVDSTARDVILRTVPGRIAAPLLRLSQYDQETAGGMMTTDFVSILEDTTIAGAIEQLRTRSLPEDVHALPVVQSQDRLVGLVGLRDLLLGSPDATAGSVMDPGVRVVRATDDREAVAREFDRYDHEMMPVVDEVGRLLGIVTFDDIIDIIEKEWTEDAQKTVGAGAREAVYSGMRHKIRGRFPWLVVSALMMAPATLVVLRFQELIVELAILAVFMPLVAALAGNAGHQALAVTLRGIVLGEVRPDRVWPLIRREAGVGLVSGAGLGLAIAGVVAMLAPVMSDANWRLGMVLAGAMTASMSVGTLAGASIPLLMRRLGADPAQASAIFLIMVTDAVAFATLLGFTFLAVGWVTGG